MRHTSVGSRGFTIVELLIVIVVIGILAAIIIVAYNGIQQRAYELRVATAAQNYMKALIAYSVEGNPIGVDSGSTTICLGSVANYPSGDGWAAGQCEKCEAPYTCGAYVGDNADIETAIRSIATGLSASDVKSVLYSDAGLNYRGITLFNGYSNARIQWLVKGGNANCGTAFDAYPEPINDNTATLCSIVHSPRL